MKTKNLCQNCNEPGTLQRKVIDGYHVDCRPAPPPVVGSPPPGAGTTNGNLDELPIHIQVANRVTRLIPLLRDETITPQQFAVLVSDMPGCSEAFGEAAES